MKHISVLIKPASSLCNIKCKYCFYNDISSIREVRSYGKMTSILTEKMIDKIYVDLEDGDQLSLAFQGGEPSMVGLAYYEHFVACIAAQNKKVQVNYTIQTNGMIINKKWCQFLKEHHFLVGLSLDGPAIFHDDARINWHENGTFLRVMKTKQLLDTYQIDYNILSVLSIQMAQQPDQMFQFIKDESIEYIQFIPCLADLKAKLRHHYALTPEAFYHFYDRLLVLWMNELRNKHYYSIKLFDDLYHLLVNQRLTACGINGQCQIQYVIESDGSVFPCDFYVLDKYRLGYIQEKSLKELFEHPMRFDFLCQKQEISNYCHTCSYSKLCGGGCKRMENVIYVAPDKNFCGFQALLQKYIDHLPEIVSLLQTEDFVCG